MSFHPAQLADRLAACAETVGAARRYVLAFSGGLDSTVLLHALTKLDTPVIAVHVNHGLQSAADSWSISCKHAAQSLGVEFIGLNVEVPSDTGLGTEAAAREARYRALSDCLQEGDWLLTAHHQDDQAETLLLNLLRGSGADGLAGIGVLQRLESGCLVRPLLEVSRRQLEAYAETVGLEWVDDPSNGSEEFDRNFLRLRVLPLLASRWPSATAQIARSASLAAESAELQRELAAMDLDSLGGVAQRLPLAGLRALVGPRQRNLIRYALRKLELPAPTQVQLGEVLSSVIGARDDATPHVTWPGVSVRRYRDTVFFLPDSTQEFSCSGQAVGNVVVVGPGLGELHIAGLEDQGLDPELLAQGLTVRRRVGGERIHLKGQSHTKSLKKLLQENGIVPWMRDRLPLLYQGERLVAVADLWLAADAQSSPGLKLDWRDRPALH